MKQGVRSTSIPRAKIEKFLKSLGRYVILRNHDIWLSFNRGGDLDILVEDLKLAEQALKTILGPPLFQINRSYVREYFFEWGHLDLLPGIEWRGAVYLDNKSVFLEADRSEFGFLKPRINHEAVISWFSSLLWGGFFKERYRTTILKAAEDSPEALKQSLIYAVGDRWGSKLWQMVVEKTPEKSEMYVPEIRRAVWLQSLGRAGHKTVFRYALFWAVEVNLRLSPPIPWVAILGPDGSGKTSMLTEFTKEFSSRFGGVEILHWRPGLLLPPGNGTGPCTDPHGKPPRGTLTSLMKLCFLFLDWVVGYWKRLVHHRAKGHLLFFDRHFVDMLVDPRRYRYGGPMWLVNLTNIFIPKPDLYILLDAPPEILQFRKQEVPFEESRRQRMEYLKLVKNMSNGRIVDASKPVKEMVYHVYDIVVSCISAARHGG